MNRICQNDLCDHKLAPHQRKYCCRECYHEARHKKQGEEAEKRINKFYSDDHIIIDVVDRSRAQVEQTKSYDVYRDMPGVYYKLVVCVDENVFNSITEGNLSPNGETLD